MEQLEEIIIKSIETLRSSKKQPNEEVIHNVIKKDLPEVSMDKLKERLNHLLQKEKILNKPHKGKNSYYNIKEVCPETPHPPSHSPETPHPSSHPPETSHPPSSTRNTTSTFSSTRNAGKKSKNIKSIQ